MVEFETEVYIYVPYSKYSWKKRLGVIWAILTGQEVEYSDTTLIEYEPW